MFLLTFFAAEFTVFSFVSTKSPKIYTKTVRNATTHRRFEKDTCRAADHRYGAAGGSVQIVNMAAGTTRYAPCGARYVASQLDMLADASVIL